MARYKLNTNVRLKNTLVVVYIVDIFEDFGETRYTVVHESGRVEELKESALRFPVMLEAELWLDNNPKYTFTLYSFVVLLTGFLLGLIF